VFRRVKPLIYEKISDYGWVPLTMLLAHNCSTYWHSLNSS
jgi:hypothetical protein